MTDKASPSPDPSQEEYDDQQEEAKPTTPSKRKKNQDGSPRKKRAPTQSTGPWTKEGKVALFKHYVGKESESDWSEVERITGKTKKQCLDYWRNRLMPKIIKGIEGDGA